MKSNRPFPVGEATCIQGKGHSCETQLTVIINNWAKILDTKRQVDTSVLDFEKAFDKPLMNSLKANCLATVLVERH